MRAIRGFLALTLLYCYPPELLAQEVPETDPVASMPFRLGPVGLSPTVSITNFGIDSNVFNDSATPRADFTLTATPRVVARARSGRILVSGALATGMVYYQKFEDQRSIDYGTDARADIDLEWFHPYAAVQRLDTRERLNAELDVRAPRVSTQSLIGTRFSNSLRTALRFEARRSSVTFDEASVFEGIVLNRTLNSDTTVFEGAFDFALTPLTTLSVMAARQQDRFELSPERDANSVTVMPSLTFAAPAILQGSIGVGFRTFDGAAASLPDYRGLVFKGALSHTIAERTRVDLGLARDVQYSFEVLEPYYLTTGVRVTLTRQLFESFEVRGTASRDILDYRTNAPDASIPASRRDRLNLISAGAGYRWSPTIRIGLDVEWANRASDRQDRKYDRTRLLGSASYGF